MRFQLVRYDMTAGAGIPEYENAVLRPEFNRRGRFSLTLDSAKVPPQLLEEGVRVVVQHEGGVWSGPLASEAGESNEDGTTTFEFVDDFGVVMDLLSPVNPAQPIEPAAIADLGQAVSTGAQTPGTTTNQGGYYAWPAVTSAEGAIKRLIGDTLAWWGIGNVVVAPDLGRGDRPAMLPSVRFDRLEESLGEILDASGLGLSIRQRVQTNGALEDRITVDVWTPQEFGQIITPSLGILEDDGRFSRMRRPVANAVVVGGPGQDAERAFALVRDEESIARHGVIPDWTDATTSPKYPEGMAEEQRVAKYIPFIAAPEAIASFRSMLAEAAAKVLAEGRMTAALEVSLATTEGFYLGTRVHEDGTTERGFLLGDLVNVFLGTVNPDEADPYANGTIYTERIRGLTITDTADEGYDVVTPRFGDDNSDPTEQLIGAVAQLQTALARYTRRT